MERRAAFVAKVFTGRQAAETGLNLGLVASGVSCLEGYCPYFVRPIQPSAKQVLNEFRTPFLLASEAVTSGLRNLTDLQVDLQQVRKAVLVVYSFRCYCGKAFFIIA